MEKTRRCPVCHKPLTQAEYDRALGLWKHKQEHIKHLEAERRELKQQERLFKQKAKQEAREFKKHQAKLLRDTKRVLANQAKTSAQRLKKQRVQLERSFSQKMKGEIKKGVERGVWLQKKQLMKQEAEFRKSKNKMVQLENSLKLSAKKYEQANQEITNLKAQIEQGITPQIEGLLEEGKLLERLKRLFPQDGFKHPGKGGDIIQIVMERRAQVGKIVYECKKVKHFNKKHIEQAKEARRVREADFAILVTNAFPSKKQYYFVEKTVFVISPVSLEPIIYTIRESLVRIALLRMSNEAKEKAVQKVYDFLSSNEYHNKMNDVAGQLIELGKDLKSEITYHKRTWVRRYQIYRSVFSDVGLIDYKLKELVHPSLHERPKLLLGPKKEFVHIEELDRRR